jgi:hypothetical protein
MRLEKRNIFKLSVIFLAIFFVGIIVGVQIFVSRQASLKAEDLPLLAEGEIRVFFNFGNDNVRIFDGPTVQGMTVLDTIKQSAKAGSFQFEYVLDKGRVYVGAINGFINQKNATWHFYLNNTELVEETLEFQRVKAGDIVKVSYVLD